MTSERTSMTHADPTDLSLEQREIADLAFALGAKYADRRFDDHDASLDQWRDLSAAGLTGLSLPEDHGGAGGMLDLCIASERIAAGGFPAAKLVIATAIAGTVIARHGVRGPAGALAAGHRGRHHPLLLRVHRARGGVERQPPAHPRHRRAGRACG